MKRIFKLYAMALILCMAIIFMPNQVSAATTVSTMEDLKTALADENVTNIELGDIIKIDNDVTIDGNNKTITTALSKAFEITGGTVNFKNITIVNTASKGRCIDIRDADVTLTLDKVTLKTTSAGNNQTLNVGGNFTTKVTINVKNSTILAGQAGYGIIAFNPVNLTINNSDITGYAAIYMKGKVSSAGSAGSIINIQNGSVLTGVNNYNGDSNNFGTIVFEDINIKVNVNNSKIQATGTGGATQSVFGESSSIKNEATGNTVSVSGKSEIIAQEAIAGTANANTKVTLSVGVTSNIEVPDANRELGTISKVVDGEYVIGIPHNVVVQATTNGTVTASTQTAIKGETITLTVTPAEGYKLKALTVNGTAVTDNKFVMPDEEATVTAEFVTVETEISEEDNGDEKDESPKMGVEETTLIVATIIAIIALAGLIATRTRKRK